MNYKWKKRKRKKKKIMITHAYVNDASIYFVVII